MVGRDLQVKIVAKSGGGRTGTARYTQELVNGLNVLGVDVRVFTPAPPQSLARIGRRAGMDLGAFLNSYPLRLPAPDQSLIHIPTQTMATVLWWPRKKQPVIVTVLDIIPYLVRNDADLRVSRHPVDRVFYRSALGALRRADSIIAISDYTKQTLVEELGLAAERIHVTHLGVDSDLFQPGTVDQGVLQRYGLSGDACYAIFVGSDDPRKNLTTLFRAVAGAASSRLEIELIKVGAEQHVHERQRLVQLAHDLQIESRVHFLDNVPDSDLVHLYRASRVLVLPSWYEGFGLPVLEAMACGVPTVISNRTSLPEVGGALAITIDPASVDDLSAALIHAIEHPPAAEDLRAHAIGFSWRTTVEQTLAIYQKVWAS
ncbi:MAG: glycosyltransferase family 1 protein [Anaerolineae bacterium]